MSFRQLGAGPMTRIAHRRRTLLLTLVPVALLAAACGDDDDEATSSTPATDDAETEATGESAPETTEDTEVDGDAETVEVTAVDYSFEGLPDSVAVGTRLTLSNESDVEVHELVAFQIPDSEDRPLAELLADPANLDQLSSGGPPAAVIVAAPGSDQPGAVVGDGALTEPGRYAVVCFIPIGADPDEYLEASGEGPPEVEGGAPHFTEGMFGEITVE